MLHRAGIFVIFLCGCYPDIPIKYYIHSEWEPDEVAAILEATENWENATCLDLFEYQGIHRDAGFTDWRENLGDGKKVIYPEDSLWIDGKDGDDDAIATAAEDIIILRRFLSDLDTLSEIAGHELGHWLGLGHQDNGEPTIMAAWSSSDYNRPTPQKPEVDALCDKYGCPGNCPGRPR